MSVRHGAGAAGEDGDDGGREAASRYVFGDSAIAAERLDRLAEVFEPTTRAFLQREAPRRPGLAVDLGCGPGHTTRLLGAITAAEAVVGLDQSPAFVAAASQAASRSGAGRSGAGASSVGSPAPGAGGSDPGEKRESYRLHDVRRVPFPCGAADVVFARLVLAHLPLVSDVVAAWLTQVRPGGVLLVEEVERIDTDQPVLARYLAIVTERLRRQGSEIVAGPALAALAPAGTEVRHHLASLRPPLGDTVELFGLNLMVLDADPVMDEVLPPRERSELAGQLAALRTDRRSGTIEWTLRQTAMRADGEA